jgi:hypothetical protein
MYVESQRRLGGRLVLHRFAVYLSGSIGFDLVRGQFLDGEYIGITIAGTIRWEGEKQSPELCFALGCVVPPIDDHLRAYGRLFPQGSPMVRTFKALAQQFVGHAPPGATCEHQGYPRALSVEPSAERFI